MNDKLVKILNIAKAINTDVLDVYKPPEEGYASTTQRVLPFSILKNTRGYIEKVVNQINGCYEKGWYDACLVMMRRLLETIIIEVFEENHIKEKILDNNGNYYFLDSLISRTLSETSFHLMRNTKVSLPKLKILGDLSAHGRRFNAHLGDVDAIQGDFRVAIQELIYLAKLK